MQNNNIPSNQTVRTQSEVSDNPQNWEIKNQISLNHFLVTLHKQHIKKLKINYPI